MLYNIVSEGVHDDRKKIRCRFKGETAESQRTSGGERMKSKRNIADYVARYLERKI